MVSRVAKVIGGITVAVLSVIILIAVISVITMKNGEPEDNTSQCKIFSFI